MSWVTLSESDILDRLTSDELEQYQEGGESPSRDRITGIIAQVTAKVRGKVQSNDENLDYMGPTGTIPPEALWAAATLARNSLIATLPLSSGDTETRKEETRQANEDLNNIASGDLRITTNDGELPSVDPEYGGNELLNF